MKEKINVSISVFEKNFKMAKHAYVLNTSMEACGCASAFIGDTEPMNEERFLRSKISCDGLPTNRKKVPGHGRLAKALLPESTVHLRPSP